jgi:phenylalanyl-tRNA synthetase alpha chain
MSHSLETQVRDLLTAIHAAPDLKILNDLRVQCLGKKGFLTEAMKDMANLTADEKKEFGQFINQLKQKLTQAIDERDHILQRVHLDEKLRTETLDVTLTPRPMRQGKIHPINHVMDELYQIFSAMGFELVEGFDIEDDYHNFTALNFPIGHPAREMHDTFYLPDAAQESDAEINPDFVKRLLRTHTSAVQIRTMQSGQPPFKIMAMGRTYRSDYDMTHTPMFHQMEGLYIDKNVNMGHLKGCLQTFIDAFFETENVPLRFRPSFFPFTEPSAEMDIGCSRKDGGFKIGAGEGWMEILGCGMVHENVIRNCGLDPNEWQGFAFGMGIERIAMLKYGIPDLRTFFESDTRWLDHYGFSAC